MRPLQMLGLDIAYMHAKFDKCTSAVQEIWLVLTKI